MFKFVTIYRRVDDPEALERFFSETHLPLAEQLPGLLRSEVGRITGKPGGESRFYLMYELYFETIQAFRNALTSEPGAKLMQEITPWAKARLITWYYADAYEEDVDQKEGG
jgi:uncharacterized protein (TIGR02118 family)